jgi:DNA-binding transcriptional LysR family regulator
MDVNLRQIRAFLAVVSAGGFTRASELLHISQPALTVRIRQLEDQIGVRLIDRSLRSLELTREGRDIFPAFQKIIHDFDTVIADISKYTSAERDLLRIAALPSFCTGPLASLFVDFKNRSPGLSFILRDAVGHRIPAMVRQDEVDFGIGVDVKPEPDLEFDYLCEDRLMAVFPAGHPLGEKTRLMLRDILAFPLILLDEATSVRKMVDSAIAATGLAVNQACEATYMATAVSMVRAGLGVTLLPSSAVEIGIYKDVAARALENDGMTRKIVIIRKKNAALKPHAEAALNALRAAPLPEGFTQPDELGYFARRSA